MLPPSCLVQVGAELKSKLIDSGCYFTPLFLSLISVRPPPPLMLQEVIQAGAEVEEEMKEEKEECTRALSPPPRPLFFFLYLRDEKNISDR